MNDETQPQLLSVPQIEFLCEQDGTIEQELKRRWISYFKEDIHIVSAWLVRVHYKNIPGQKVALCVKADGADQRQIANRVSSEFKKLFKMTESLDIVFVSPEWQKQLLAVAKPFYEQHAHRI